MNHMILYSCIPMLYNVLLYSRLYIGEHRAVSENNACSVHGVAS